MEATRLAAGGKNQQVREINGERGSLCFNLERLNESWAHAALRAWRPYPPRATVGR